MNVYSCVLQCEHFWLQNLPLLQRMVFRNYGL